MQQEGTGMDKPFNPDLILHVQRKYFEQIRSGEKKEEYRAYNKYYRKRIFGKQFQNIIIVWGYPKKFTKENSIIFPYREYRITRIDHEMFGIGKLVYSFPLYDESNH